ncbi:MAG: M20/M25/M40 family metallo-hydrolase [Alphaproteobacteria bacterium]|nr:M20/M25/M40 family metallo-hydrolase [Alphaproteobacteria bacterium]
MDNTKHIIETTKELVAIESQGGIDYMAPILQYLAHKCELHGLPFEILEFEGREVGLAVPIINTPGAPIYQLNAVVDTAAIGDPKAWHTDPFVATEKDGWLYGCGVSDSKVGAAMLFELADYIKASGKNFILYFDADEHTGKFNGARAFIEKYPDTAGGAIMYPGSEELVIGSRGFYRTVAHIKGTAGPTGSRKGQQDNAILTAVKFVESLRLDVKAKSFDLPPKLTITAFHGGNYFSTIPDKVKVNIDIRTTSDFTAADAEKFLREHAHAFDGKITLEEFASMPSYKIGADSHIRTTMESALGGSGFNVPSVVCGPTNVANLFSDNGYGGGCDMTAGFGVNFKNAHAANECIELVSIAPALEVYKKFVDKI